MTENNNIYISTCSNNKVIFNQNNVEIPKIDLQAKGQSPFVYSDTYDSIATIPHANIFMKNEIRKLQIVPQQEFAKHGQSLTENSKSVSNENEKSQKAQSINHNKAEIYKEIDDFIKENQMKLDDFKIRVNL